MADHITDYKYDYYLWLTLIMLKCGCRSQSQVNSVVSHQSRERNSQFNGREAGFTKQDLSERRIRAAYHHLQRHQISAASPLCGPDLQWPRHRTAPGGSDSWDDHIQPRDIRVTLIEVYCHGKKEKWSLFFLIPFFKISVNYFYCSRKRWINSFF